MKCSAKEAESKLIRCDFCEKNFPESQTRMVTLAGILTFRCCIFSCMERIERADYVIEHLEEFI